MGNNRHNNLTSCRFDELPKGARLAIIWYYAVDNNDWALPPALELAIAHNPAQKQRVARQLTRYHRFYAQRYGDKLFAYANIPTRILTERVLRSVQKENPKFITFRDYADWYKNECHIPRHNPKGTRWACIFDGTNGELFRDGWHRFHRYVETNCRTIPCVASGQRSTNLLERLLG